MSELLKQCPFCGGKAEINNSSYGEWVECQSCLATSAPKGWHSDDDIFELWNNRQPTIADYLAQQKPMLDKTKSKMVTVESLEKFMRGGDD